MRSCLLDKPNAAARTLALLLGLALACGETSRNLEPSGDQGGAAPPGSTGGDANDPEGRAGSAGAAGGDTTGSVEVEEIFAIRSETVSCFRALAIDDQHVYLADARQLLRAPKAGGDPEIVVEAPIYHSMALHDEQVILTGPTLRGVDKRSGEITELSDLEAQHVAVDGADIYFTSMGSESAGVYLLRDEDVAPTLLAEATSINPANLTVDAGFVYWTVHSRQGSEIRRVRTVGGGAVVLQSTSPMYSGSPVLVDGGFLYWSDNIVHRAPVDGGLPVTLGANTYVRRFDVSGGIVYAANGGGSGRAPNGIVRIDGEGSVTLLAAEGVLDVNVALVAVHEEYVYFSSCEFSCEHCAEPDHLLALMRIARVE